MAAGEFEASAEKAEEQVVQLIGDTTINFVCQTALVAERQR